MGDFPRATGAFVERLGDRERVVEIGVGRRPEVAAALAERAVTVVATDVRARIDPSELPEGVRFVRDDVVDPDLAVYRDADAVYALNLPPELHRPTLEVARAVDAPLLFTTLGADRPAIPVDLEALPDGETLYAARDGPA